MNRVAAAFRRAGDPASPRPGFAESLTGIRTTPSGWVGVEADGGRVLGHAVSEARCVTIVGSWVRGAGLSAQTAAEQVLDDLRVRGVGALADLQGEFACVAVDGEDVYFLGTPSGQRRIFYWCSDGELRVASLLSDIARIAPGSVSIDRRAEEFLLGYEFLPDMRTMFEGVVQATPGTIYHWKSGALTESGQRLPEGSARDLSGAGDEEVAEAIAGAFDAAVAELVAGEKRVGVALGGFDSALIAARLRHLGLEVATFTFRYEDESYNQPLVEELAEECGIDHHWVDVSPAVIRRGLERYGHVFNQAVCQPHYVIATAHLAEQIRARGLTLALTGDGCDGLFLGYPTVHLRARVVQRLSKLAPLIVPIGRLLTRWPALERALGHPYRVARNLFRVLGRPEPQRSHITATTLDPTSLRMLRPDRPEPFESSETVLARLATPKAGLSRVRLAYSGKSAVGLNRVKLEGCAAVSGVALRSPFLHPDFSALAETLPEDRLRPAGGSSMATGKDVLMRVVEQRDMLAERYVRQAKRSPVTAPVDSWYQGELSDFVRQRLRTLPFAADARYVDSLLRPKLAEEIFRNHVGISRYAGHAIGLLAAYAALCEPGLAEAAE